MALKTLVVITVASVVAVATQAAARAPAPLVPTALVEDVKSATADVEFMDYVGNRQVIKLGPSDVLVLSYLKSCEHETITGGTVAVGTERSEVQGGQVVRTKVPCDGGNIQLSAAAGEPKRRERIPASERQHREDALCPGADGAAPPASGKRRPRSGYRSNRCPGRDPPL